MTWAIDFTNQDPEDPGRERARRVVLRTDVLVCLEQYYYRLRSQFQHSASGRQ